MGAHKPLKDCPHCGARVKREKYASHIKKVHEAIADNGDIARKAIVRPPASARKSLRKAKKAIFFAVVCASVIVLSSVAIYVWSHRETGGVSTDPAKVELDYTQHSISTPQGWTVWGCLYETSKDAPLVVLLHGLNTDRSSWDPLVPQLRSNGYNVLAIDLPGHGRSNMCNGSYKTTNDPTFSALDYEEMPGDVSKLIFRTVTDTGISDQRVIVVGASIGANVAIIYGASDSKVDGLILLSPVKQFVSDIPESHASEIGSRPVMIQVSTGDGSSINTAHTLDDTYANSELYPYTTDFHGTNILTGVSESIPDILAWLISNAPV